MKRLAFFILVMALSSQVFAGGISGGGGGTIILDPAGTEYTRNQLSEGRLGLLMFLKAYSFNIRRPELFKSENNIIQKVKSIPLKIENKMPCFDQNGEPVDASVSRNEDSICISAFTIGQKVTELTAYPQLIALLAHEYSHLLGYNEEEAQAFQKEVLQAVKTMSASQGWETGKEFFNTATTVGMTIDYVKRDIMIDRLDRTFPALFEASRMPLIRIKQTMRALDFSEASIAEGVMIRIKNLELYTCMKYAKEPVDQMHCDRMYKLIFDDRSEIWIQNAGQKMNMADYMPTGWVPNLMQDPKKALAETELILDELFQLRGMIEKQLEIKD